jgi:hypothetical protein
MVKKFFDKRVVSIETQTEMTRNIPLVFKAQAGKNTRLNCAFVGFFTGSERTVRGSKTLERVHMKFPLRKIGSACV